eukprot:12337766-Karenia_brevis.AAC.1
MPPPNVPKKPRLADAPSTVFCARFLMASCNNPRCNFKHDCPFCPASENRAKACFQGRLRRFGIVIPGGKQQDHRVQDQGGRAMGSDQREARDGDSAPPHRRVSRSPEPRRKKF